VGRRSTSQKGTGVKEEGREGGFKEEGEGKKKIRENPEKGKRGKIGWEGERGKS